MKFVIFINIHILTPDNAICPDLKVCNLSLLINVKRVLSKENLHFQHLSCYEQLKLHVQLSPAINLERSSNHCWHSEIYDKDKFQAHMS